MGWETRKGGGSYYTRSKREGGRVVREYVGSGESAQLIAQMDELEQEQRAAQRELARIRRGESDTLDALTREFYDQVEAVLRAALAEAGYHRHARGPWRKHRKKEEAGNETE